MLSSFIFLAFYAHIMQVKLNYASKTKIAINFVQQLDNLFILHPKHDSLFIYGFVYFAQFKNHWPRVVFTWIIQDGKLYTTMSIF